MNAINVCDGCRTVYVRGSDQVKLFVPDGWDVRYMGPRDSLFHCNSVSGVKDEQRRLLQTYERGIRSDYARRLRAYERLPWWRRLFAKRPEMPLGGYRAVFEKHLDDHRRILDDK